MKKSPYQTLGITGDFNKEDIDKHYFKLIKKFNSEHYPEQFMKIREAYEAILNFKFKTPNFPKYQIK